MIYKRGKVYWYQFQIHGRRIRESAKTTNKAAALKAEAEKRVSLGNGGRPSYPETNPIFRDFVEEFLNWSLAQNKRNTHKRYRVSSKSLTRFFDRMKLDEISTCDIEQFKLKRLKQCSPAGVNRDLAALRYMLNFAVRNGCLRASPFRVKFLQEGPGSMRIVSHEEEDLYLKHAHPTLRDIVTLIIQTGMRPMEVYALRTEHVNLKKGYVFVAEGKTKFARRTIPLTPKAREVLERRMKPGYLFPHRDDPNTHITQCRSHDDLVRKLKLDLRIYDFRHTFGSRMAMAGVDLPTLKELMGHSTIVMTMKYVHPTPEHKIEAMRKYTSHNSSHSGVE
jgi:integrase